MLSAHDRVWWFDWAIWVELLLGVGLLFFTVHVWYQWLAGCLVFGIVKGFVALTSGRDFFSRYQMPASNFWLVVAILYCVIAILLMVRFMSIPPTHLDRVAITVFFLCLLMSGSSFPSVSAILGLVGLTTSWLVYRFHFGKAGPNEHALKNSLTD